MSNIQKRFPFFTDILNILSIQFYLKIEKPS